MLSPIRIFDDFVSHVNVSFTQSLTAGQNLGHQLLQPNCESCVETPWLGDSVQTVPPQFMSAFLGGQAVVAKLLSVKNSGLFVTVVSITVTNTNQPGDRDRWHSAVTKE